MTTLGRFCCCAEACEFAVDKAATPTSRLRSNVRVFMCTAPFTAEAPTLMGDFGGNKSQFRDAGCPLWAKSGHVQCRKACLLCPRERTPKADGAHAAANRKTASRRSLQNSNLHFDHAAGAAVFCFRRHPNNPSAPRPVAKSGNAPGIGVEPLGPAISKV